MPNDDNEAKAAQTQAILDRLFSSAALLGDALYYFGREILGVSFDGYEETEAEAAAKDQEWLSFFGDLVSPLASSRKDPVQESESPGQQTIQVMTFLRPEVRELFSSSALYEIFSEALKLLGRKGGSLDQMIDGLDPVTLSGCWIISKRVFVLGHGSDCITMVEALLSKARGAAVAPLHLSEASTEDRESLDAFMNAYFSGLPSRDSGPVDAEAPAAAPLEITEIINTDKLIIPTSKVNRELLAIARAGGPVSIDVGGGATIIAQITGEDGKALDANLLDKDIMDALGQIYIENGMKPFIVTPSQICRRILHADSDTNISEASINAILESLDKLLVAPSALDYTEQAKKHDRLKENQYLEHQRTMSGTLVPGIHLKDRTTTYHGQTVEHAFKIYDMPMLFRYSYSIGQLVTIPGAYLTGTRGTPNGQKKSSKAAPQKRLTLQEAGIRRYLLERIEYTKKLKENRNKKLAYRKEPIPKTFSAKYAFESIAKETGYEITPRRIRTLRDQTYAFMQEQVKIKNIISCEFYYVGRTISGIKITL